MNIDNLAAGSNPSTQSINLSIVDYQPSYYSQLYRLLSDVYASRISRTDLESNYLGPDRQIVLALNNQTVVGCAFLTFCTDYVRSSRTVFVTYVAVASSSRHQGIGAKLFIEIEKRARNRSCSAIELTSADSRTDAHAFYNALHFSRKKTTVFIKELNSL